MSLIVKIQQQKSGASKVNSPNASLFSCHQGECCSSKIVNKSAYSLLEKKFLEFLISVRRLKVFMEAGNLEPKTDHSIHLLHARG